MYQGYCKMGPFEGVKIKCPTSRIAIRSKASPDYRGQFAIYCFTETFWIYDRDLTAQYRKTPFSVEQIEFDLGINYL